MTPEEQARWKRIEEKHEALAISLELLVHDTAEWQKEQKRLDTRERNAREAILAGIAGYLRVLNEGDEPREEAR